MKIQACIPVALACIHNIIHINDSLDLQDADVEPAVEPEDSEHSIIGSIASGVPMCEDQKWMSELWDTIAEEIWATYVAKQI